MSKKKNAFDADAARNDAQAELLAAGELAGELAAIAGGIYAREYGAPCPPDRIPTPAKLLDPDFLRQVDRDTWTEYGRALDAIAGRWAVSVSGWTQDTPPGYLRADFVAPDPVAGTPGGTHASRISRMEYPEGYFADACRDAIEERYTPDFDGDARAWRANPRAKRGKHPAAFFVEEWLNKPRPISQRSLLVKSHEDMHLNRIPGIVALASAAIHVYEGGDGLELTAEPKNVRRYRLPQNQTELFPGPRKLDGRATGGLILSSAEKLDIANERETLRGDYAFLASLCYALSGRVELTEDAGAVLVGGKNTEANRKRFNKTTAALRGSIIIIDPKTYKWLPIAHVSPDLDGRVIVGPPRWWLKGGQAQAMRFSGGLLRQRALIVDGQPGRGTTAGYFGVLQRTIAGLENALTWGATAGKGKGGRLPLNVVPERKGGPGPEIFVPWRTVLEVSGEPVAPDTPMRSNEGERYRHRLERLEEAGYFVPDGGGTAPAGDTVEIVRIVRRRRIPGGIVIRASARYCEAYVKGRKTRIPAAHLLPAAPKKVS